MNNTVFIASIACMITAFIVWVIMRFQMHVWKQQSAINQSNSDAWQKVAEQQQQTAKNFFNACRLIQLHKTGRIIVLTFARGENTFTVDFVSVLSFDAVTVCELAGLDEGINVQ